MNKRGSKRDKTGDPSAVPSTVLATVRSRIHDHAGLAPPDWVLEARISDRLSALGLADCDQYAMLLDRTGDGAGPRELDALVEALRVGETRFFRHPSHILALTDHVLPLLSAGGHQHHVRAWSAGCATGEEAFTIAMVLRRLLPDPRCTVSVLATDLSEDALAFAREKRYPERALADVPVDWREWGFTKDGADDAGRTYWRIADHVAELVTFEQQNLADSELPMGFDIIWCRNVLIYFSAEARHRALCNLIHSLTPNGFLFLGYAETLRNHLDHMEHGTRDTPKSCGPVPNKHGSRAEAFRTPDAVLYRRSTRANTNEAAYRTKNPRDEPPGYSIGSTAVDSTLQASRPVSALIELRGRYTDGRRLAEELGSLISGTYNSALVDLDGADYLSDACATVMRRARAAAAAADIDLQFLAQRPGTRRFLARSGLVGGAQICSEEEP